MINLPKTDVKLENYLQLTEREPVKDLGSSLKSVRLIRAMEKLNRENLKSIGTPEKIKIIKSRIGFISKTLTTVKLTLAETMLYLVELQEYYNLSAKFNDENLSKWTQNNKLDLIAGKEKILERTLDHDLDVFRTTYDEMTALNESPALKKRDTDNLTPDEIKTGIIEFEKIRATLKANQKCLFDSSCHFCGLSISTKACSADPIGRANKMLPEKIDEAIINFNRRFEKWAK